MLVISLLNISGIFLKQNFVFIELTAVAKHTCPVSIGIFFLVDPVTIQRGTVSGFREMWRI